MESVCIIYVYPVKNTPIPNRENMIVPQSGKVQFKKLNDVLNRVSCNGLNINDISFKLSLKVIKSYDLN